MHKNSPKALESAARVAAERLKMSAKESEALVQRYLGYTRELSAPGAKPVPPFLPLHGINDDTVTLVRCDESLSLFDKLAHKVRCVSIGGSTYLVSRRAGAATGHRHAGGETLARCHHERFFLEVIETESIYG